MIEFSLALGARVELLQDFSGNKFEK